MIDTLRLRHVLIPLFCILHMIAVAVYVLPRSHISAIRMVQQKTYDLTAPYVLMISQWQQWNIFAPDPLQRVSRYRIELQTNDRWHDTNVIDPSNLHFYTYAKTMKVLERLEGDYSRLVSPYLTYWCAKIPESAGKNIRLRASHWVLPKDMKILFHLTKNPLPITDRVIGSIRCPLDQ